MIVRKKRLLLRLLPLRMVVNGSDIYSLREKQPLIISTRHCPAQLVVSNGFHFSPPVQLDTLQQDKYALEVDCQIDDIRILSTVFVTILLFGFYWITGMRGMQVAANIPLLYLLWLFYFRRKQMLVIRPLQQ